MLSKQRGRVVALRLVCHPGRAADLSRSIHGVEKGATVEASVMFGVRVWECPRTFAATSRDCPDFTRLLAAECRRTWMRTSGSAEDQARLAPKWRFGEDRPENVADMMELVGRPLD